MALSYGALLMGKHKKADLEKIQAQAREEQRKARKRGLRSAIGGTLGSILAPAIMGSLGFTGGPLGAMAGKMIISRLGRELGEETGPKVNTDAIGKDTHGFYKDIAKDYRLGLDDAKDALNQQQWMQSVMNPLQEYGLGKAGKELGKFAEGTKAGQKYTEFIDKGGLGLGEKIGGGMQKIGEKAPLLSQIGQYISSPFQQVALEDRWDYEAPDPDDIDTGVSYEEGE